MALILIDLLALGLIGWFAYSGWRKGTVVTLLPIAGLLGGYVGAYLWAGRIGVPIGKLFNLPTLIALPIGGALVFLVLTTAFRLVTHRIARRRLLRQADGWRPSFFDAAGGAVLGAVWAAAIVVVLAVGLTAVRSLTGSTPEANPRRSLTGRFAAAVSERAVAAAAESMTGNPIVARALALLSLNPAEGAAVVNELAGNPNLQALFRSDELRDAIVASDFAAVANHPRVQRLVRDDEFLEAAERIGLVDGTLDAPDALAEQLVQRIAPVMRTVEDLSTDPTVQSILDKPQIATGLQDGNVALLLKDPDFNTLTEKLLERLRANR